jgi:hypothetical protein
MRFPPHTSRALIKEPLTKLVPRPTGGCTERRLHWQPCRLPGPPGVVPQGSFVLTG